MPTERVLDPRVTRGIILHILAAYSEPCNKNEDKIDRTLPLLLYAEPEVRNQAVNVSKLWMGLKSRDPLIHRRLIFYRLRHLDKALSELESMTRPRKKK